MVEITITALCTLVLTSGFFWLRSRTLSASTVNTNEVVRGQEDNSAQPRTHELESKNRHLLEALQYKSDFIHTVTHELHGPLTSIKGFAEILKQDMEELDPASRQQFIAIIHSESHRINDMIDKLAELHRIDTGAITWHDSDQNLNTLLHQVVAEFHDEIEQKGLKLINELPPTQVSHLIHIDPDKIKKVLRQLFSNALFFTEHGEIGISLDQFRQRYKAPAYRIKVWDSGVGIPQIDQPRIFNRFYKSNVRNVNQGGAGLGLAICREYLAHYQAEISVSSHPEQGSLFIINIPSQETFDHERNIFKEE